MEEEKRKDYYYKMPPTSFTHEIWINKGGHPFPNKGHYGLCIGFNVETEDSFFIEVYDTTPDGKPHKLIYSYTTSAGKTGDQAYEFHGDFHITDPGPFKLKLRNAGNRETRIKFGLIFDCPRPPTP